VWKQLHLGVFTYGIGMGVRSWDVSAGVGSIGAINVHMCSSSNTYMLHRNCVIFYKCLFMLLTSNVTFFLESATATECLKIHSYAVNWNVCYFPHLPLMEAGMNTIEK
jgi:hypothetical protein